MDFRTRYIAFLDQLRTLAKSHDDLTDTDVRERLHQVINYFFIWGKPLKGFPKRFEMMSARGDRALAPKVRSFVVDARRIAAKTRIRTGAARHALIEDPLAVNRNGDSYDVYIGSSDKVLPAEKPAPDSSYAARTRASRSRREIYLPKVDPQEMAITVRGRTIVPVFDSESGVFLYEGPNGLSTGLSQGFYGHQRIREIATAIFDDPDGDDDSILGKSRRPKSTKKPGRRKK